PSTLILTLSLHDALPIYDPVAADATCARLMGLDPEKITHIRAASQFLGNSLIAQIDQLGEPVRTPMTPFELVPEFDYLRETNSLDRKSTRLNSSHVSISY